MSERIVAEAECIVAEAAVAVAEEQVVAAQQDLRNAHLHAAHILDWADAELHDAE